MNAPLYFVCANCAAIHHVPLSRFTVKCSACGEVVAHWEYVTEEAAQACADSIIARRTTALVLHADSQTLDALTRALDR